MTFAAYVADYVLAGWTCVLPVPAATKTPPPAGYTGAAGRNTEVADLVRWAGTHADHSIALRMPDGVIGIDVDDYLKGEVQKNGLATFNAAIARWGQLPPTWTSTAREPEGPSRIYFFRVPAQRYATKLGPDVEIIQRHHRYAVVAPSPHEQLGTLYRWYDPSGQPSDLPPKPGELPELPTAWVAGLAEGAAEQGPVSADPSSGHRLLEQIRDDWRPECAEVTSARLAAVDAMSRADAGSRHDTMVERTYPLVQLGAAGHTGAAAAILELADLWARVTAGEDRMPELEDALVGAARKAVTVVGTHQAPRDPCLMAVGFPLPPAPPAAPGSPEADFQLEIPRWAAIRELIGTQTFDPRAGLDQMLAEAVLQRTYPLLRYAYDAKAWMLRCPLHWEVSGKLSAWAVAQVATLMPLGDPTAEKGTEQHERATKRARLMSTAGARAVAGKMDDLVAGGAHPAALALADLDQDPVVLWAGGMPYDLRASHGGPALAAWIDVATPHQHTAAVMPEVRPTPLWDAFLAAVWPDEEIRRWAVRVLSVALTGYADRALPILLGETGRGKTQVVHLLMSTLGTYAHAANPKLLSASSNEHDTIVADLKGRRLSFIDEAPSEAKAGQERLKQLTGGAELNGRRMNQDTVTFQPTHTLVLTANDEPTLTDPAVRSRVRLIPCEGDPEAVRQARGAIGHVSGPVWAAEAPGVLAAMMAEAAAWLADPASALVDAAPEHIRYLAEHLGAEQDPVGVWVAEETEPHEEGTASRELYQAFTASCLRNNLRRDQIPSETKWGRILTRLGHPGWHTHTGKRRPLRVRQGGGFLPGMPPPQPLTGHVTPTGQPETQDPASSAFDPAVESRGDGSPTTSDGFLSGSEPHPSREFPQVNHTVSPIPDGFDGFEEENSPSHTRARAQESRPGSAPNPSARTKRERSPEAIRKAAEKSEEKRFAAIAEAAGEATPLPVVVTRDGAVRRCSVEDADALLGTLTGPGTRGELTVDVETTGFPVGHADYALRTIQLGDEHLAVVLDAADQTQTIVAREHLAAAEILHAHSATADLVPLADAGLLDLEEGWRRMHDTAILAKLADPSSTGNDADLKNLSKAVLREAAVSPAADKARAALFKAGRWLTDTEVTTSVERSGWAQVDPGCETMARYAASDVLDDAALARRLPAPAPQVLERERTVQRMTARVAYTGIRLDGGHTDQLHELHTAERSRHAEAVRAFDVDNPGSNAQLGEAFKRIGAWLPRTPTGKPSVSAGVLEPMRALEGPVGELAREVLDYRHHDTALKLFLEPYRELVRRGDGRARPTVYTLGADTGRMSCVRPNLQQVPREGGFRACITADPGHLLVSADFAGVELRVAAALSGDHNLRTMLDDPERDLHWETARLAFGPDATKAQRYAVKRGVFGRIYGGGVGAIARGVGVSEAVARQIIDALDALTPGLSEWSRMVRAGIESGRTQFPTAAGRVIHLPKQSPHAGPNYCIQGTARELLVDALLRWRETRWGGCVLWPVHDEIVVMVPEDQADEATAALTACMTSELAGVPIVAEASTPSYAWSDSA